MDFSYLIQLCTPDINSLQDTLYTIYLSMFISGIVTGLIHCSYMCSPFLVMQISAKMSSDKNELFSEITRIKHSLLIPYHAGRITTYCIIGAITASLTGYISGWWENFSSIILIIAGLMIIILSINIKSKKFFNFSPKLIKSFTELLFKHISRKTNAFGSYITGIVLGLLPCAALYYIILIASSLENPMSAALGMLFFGIGTIPGLFISSFSGHYIIGAIRNKFVFIPNILMIITGLWLVFIGIQIILK